MTSDRPAAPRMRTSQRGRRRHSLGGLAILAFGLIGLADAADLLPGWLNYWPAALIGLGVVWLFAATRPDTSARAGGPRLAPPTFAIDRGAASAAWLLVDAACADVSVDTFVGASQLAVGQFAGFGGPRLSAEGDLIRLALTQRDASPFVGGPWTASLAKNTAWRLDVRAGLGQVNLDLPGLSVTHARLWSLAGDVNLALPNSPCEAEVGLALGDLVVKAPDGAAARVRLQAGSLVEVSFDAQRWAEAAEGEWVTPDFDQAERRVTVTARLFAGDLRLA